MAPRFDTHCSRDAAMVPTPTFFRSKAGRAVCLVVGLLGIPIAVLLTLQWRALADFELSTVEVLRQMSAHTAEELAQQIQRDFKAPAFNLLEQVDHNAVRELRLDDIVRTLRERAPVRRRSSTCSSSGAVCRRNRRTGARSACGSRAWERRARRRSSSTRSCRRRSSVTRVISRPSAATSRSQSSVSTAAPTSSSTTSSMTCPSGGRSVRFSGSASTAPSCRSAISRKSCPD